MPHVYFFKFPLKPSLGGAEFHTLKLAQDFQKSGYHVKSITSDSRLLRLFEKNHLARRKMFMGLEPTNNWALFLWPLTYLIARIRFKNLLNEIPPGSILFLQSLIEKLILTPLAFVLPSHKTRGFRVIWLEHKIPGRWLKLNPLKFRYLKLARKTALITVSNFAKREFVNLGIPEKNIQVIYPTPSQLLHPVRLQNLQAGRSLAFLRPGGKVGGFTIGILSRLDSEKGVLDFVTRIIPQLKKHTDWKLIIGGEGEESENLQQIINNGNLKKQIKLLGFINDLDKFFSQISVLVYPTKVPEAFGISVLEAMARAVPVIASNLGALPEIMPHGKNGFLVDQNHQSGQWEERLDSLTNLELFRAASEAAFARAQTFSKTDRQSVLPILSRKMH